MFWLLIKTDNITFKLQLSEKLEEYNIAHEAHRTYTDFRDEKARACLVGAAIYAGVWVASIVTVSIGNRKR